MDYAQSGANAKSAVERDTAIKSATFRLRTISATLDKIAELAAREADRLFGERPEPCSDEAPNRLSQSGELGSLDCEIDKIESLVGTISSRVQRFQNL